MVTKNSSRSRSQKLKIENYYKILGVRANATQESIKQKYIAGVKAFPPETHPEEFQQVRRAYETLRDPVKRREYDLMRKYGGKLEKIMEDAWAYAEKGKYEKAEKLVNQALEILPDNHNLHLVLAQIALLKNDKETFEAKFELVENLALDEDKVIILTLKARLLYEADLPEEAILVLDQTRARYPEHISDLLNLYSVTYADLDQDGDFWQLLLDLVPKPGTEKPEDVSILIHWLNTMFDLEMWSFKAKIQQSFRKLIKSLDNAEDKLMVMGALHYEYEGYFEVGRFREAEMYVDFLYYLDSANPEIRQLRSRTQELMRLQKELNRLIRDDEVFPGIVVKAYKWIHQDYWSPEEAECFEEFPAFDEPTGEDLEIDELYAMGIITLRKKYPLLFKYFQERWESIFAERSQNLNREARRRVKL